MRAIENSGCEESLAQEPWPPDTGKKDVEDWGWWGQYKHTLLPELSHHYAAGPSCSVLL